MSILKVARMGHPVLRRPARPLQPSELRSPEVQRLIEDMIDTMKEYHGIGLAAPQVHESLRIFVAGSSDDNVITIPSIKCVIPIPSVEKVVAG